MKRTAYISKQDNGLYLIKIIPDNSNLPRHQEWIEVTDVVLSDEVREQKKKMAYYKHHKASVELEKIRDTKSK